MTGNLAPGEPSTNDFFVGPAEEPDTYRLVLQLGTGGEGEVWKAVLPLSARGRRTVAVKIQVGTGSAEERRSWSTTGDLLGSLTHPGLVRVTDAFVGPRPHRAGEAGTGAARPTRYLVMEYVEGGTLLDWCADHPEATPAQRLRMMQTVAAALDHMHSGIDTEVAVAHGDVKPSNIVVRPEGGTVLVDLGLTRLTDAAGAMGRSGPYAAPELRGPDPMATPAADRFAFAVTLAQVLTGEPPPRGPGGWLDAEALARLLAGHPTTGRRHALVERIMTMVTAPQEARVAGLARWLAEALDSLSAVTLEPGRAGPRPTPTVPDRGDATPRRPVRLVALTLVSVLSVLVLGAVVPSPRATADRPAATAGAPSTTAPSPAAPSPSRDRYGCDGLIALPATVPLTGTDPPPLGELYNADSYGPTATAFQLHPGGYIDQVFVATQDSITTLAAVPGIDFRVGPAAATMRYELRALDGRLLAPPLDVRVDRSNVNGSVAGTFDRPVPVQPGRLYVLRVINPDAAPAIGFYLRAPGGQRVVDPRPACLVDADPRTGVQPVLEAQGRVLSATVGTER